MRKLLCPRCGSELQSKPRTQGEIILVQCRNCVHVLPERDCEWHPNSSVLSNPDSPEAQTEQRGRIADAIARLQYEKSKIRHVVVVTEDLLDRCRGALAVMSVYGCGGTAGARALQAAVDALAGSAQSAENGLRVQPIIDLAVHLADEIRRACDLSTGRQISDVTRQEIEPLRKLAEAFLKKVEEK